jgi:hypothetical protein
MIGLNELEKLLANPDEIPPSDNLSGKPRVKRFTNRQYTLIGYERKWSNHRWYFKKVAKIENVSAVTRKREIERLKENGCYRVDSIETETVANEFIGKTIKSRRMEFAKQIFAAANRKFIPKPIESETREATQKTAAWEILNNLPDTPLDYRPKVKVKDRQNAMRAERKRNQMLTKNNGREDQSIKIFDRKTQGFLFSSESEAEIVNYIQSNELALENIILYVNNETYWQLVELEK